MKCKNVSIILLIFILTIVFCISCYILLKDLKEYKESDKSTEKLIEESIEIKEETQKRSIDWEYLKSINKDIIAWIEIDNTKIDYPILKDKDVYYLKHTFDKKYNSNGSIFTTNSYPFEDKETIVYGHNMKNGSMFSDLGKYLNKDFLNSHFNFKIYTPTCNYEARIFSVYSIGVETESNNIKSLNFEDRIEYYKKASEYNIETDSNIKKIVKLSTCSYLNATTIPTDQRYYIVANLIQL
jgi:sortase B